MEFSRQEYWSGLPCPSPEDRPCPGIEPGSPALQADPLLSEPPGKPQSTKALFFFFLLLKDKLLWKRPLGQQIQWWLFAKLLLDLFPPPPGETEWTNHLYVSINYGNLLKTWLTCEADFSQVPGLSGRWALSLRCHLYFAISTFQEYQAPCVPLWRRPPANTWTARITMTSGPFLCCCQD